MKSSYVGVSMVALETKPHDLQGQVRHSISVALKCIFGVLGQPRRCIAQLKTFESTTLSWIVSPTGHSDDGSSSNVDSGELRVVLIYVYPSVEPRKL